jgi:aconitase B
MIDPTEHGLPSLLGDLELDRPLRFLLHDDGTMENALALRDILHAKTHQVTAAKLTVDRQVEERQISQTLG